MESRAFLDRIDASLKRYLKPHQLKGISFMHECLKPKVHRSRNGHGCILAHSMGLGKTFQVVTLLHTLLKDNLYGMKNAMIVVPKNVVENWHNEFEQWLYNNETYVGGLVVYNANEQGTLKNRLKLFKNCEESFRRDGTPYVIIIGYDLFKSLSKNEQFHPFLYDPGPDCIVCDEGHILKNDANAIFNTLKKVKTLRRICVTGTPFQNNLVELFNTVEFTCPGFLGPKAAFQTDFVKVIEAGQTVDANKFEIQLMLKKEVILWKKMSEIMQAEDISILKEELPEKTEYILKVKLTARQTSLYNQYLEHVCERSKGRQLLKDYHTFSTICAHPSLLLNTHLDQSNHEPVKTKRVRSTERLDKSFNGSDEEAEDGEDFDGSDTPWYEGYVHPEDRLEIDQSNKLLLLMDIIKECQEVGDKLLVFSQSLKVLRLIEEHLSYTDSTDSMESVESVESFIESNSTESSTFHGMEWTKDLDYFIIEGKTAIHDRSRIQAKINDPNDARARLLLISTKAGSLGTNLVGANRVVLFDAAWNPVLDRQSLFRVYRIGQTKAVYLYRFIAANTLEDQIFNRQIIKHSMSNQIILQANVIRSFKRSELNKLYELNDVEPDDFEPNNLTDDPVLRNVLSRNSRILTCPPILHESFFLENTNDKLSKEECQEILNSTLNPWFDDSVRNEKTDESAYITKGDDDCMNSVQTIKYKDNLAHDKTYKMALDIGLSEKFSALVAYVNLICCELENLLPKENHIAEGSVSQDINFALQKDNPICETSSERVAFIWHLFCCLQGTFRKNPVTKDLYNKYMQKMEKCFFY